MHGSLPNCENDIGHLMLSFYWPKSMGIMPVKERIDWLGRKLFWSQFQGHYGPAGYVITVEGSPVRATIVVHLSHGFPHGIQSAYHMEQDNCKRIKNDKFLKIIAAFIKHLNE